MLVSDLGAPEMSPSAAARKKKGSTPSALDAAAVTTGPAHTPGRGGFSVPTALSLGCGGGSAPMARSHGRGGGSAAAATRPTTSVSSRARQQHHPPSIDPAEVAFPALCRPWMGFHSSLLHHLQLCGMRPAVISLLMDLRSLGHGNQSKLVEA